MHVIPLKRELADAHPKAVSSLREGRRKNAEAAPATKVPDVREEAQGDVNGKARSQCRAGLVGHQRALSPRLSPCSDAVAAPARLLGTAQRGEAFGRHLD